MFGPREYGGEPVEAGRYRLGEDLRQGGCAVVSYGRHLLRAERDDAGGRARGYGCGPQAWNDHQLRPELSRLAVEGDWREGEVDRSEPRDGKVCRCDDRQRRGLYGSAGL